MASELAEALAAVQADIPAIPKTAKATIPGKDGRQGYNYDYADLEGVTDAILPLLGKNGLAFTAWPTLDDGRFVLAYALIHKSGEERTGVYPLPAQGRPQDIGSAITYARRYCLCAVTGAAPGGEDDDGAAANGQEIHMDRPQTPRQEPPNRSHQAVRQGTRMDMWDEQRDEERPGTVAPDDVRAIKAAYTHLGFDPRTDRLKMADVSGKLLGRKLTGPKAGESHENLSYREGRKLRAELASFRNEQRKWDRGLLMERLTGIRQAVVAVKDQDAAEDSQEVTP